jgi:thiol-disulfide isomerase/thioredoxin
MKPKVKLLKLFVTVLTLLSFTSCYKKSFEIKGYIKGVSNGLIIANGHSIKDTIQLKNGHFEFNGSVDQPELVKFYVEDEEKKVETYLSPIKVFISNDGISVKAKLAKYGRLTYDIVGGKEHQKYVDFTEQLTMLDSMRRAYFDQQTLLMEGKEQAYKVVSQKYKQWGRELDAVIPQCLEWNESMCGTYIVLDNFNYIPLDQVTQLANGFSTKMQKSPYLEDLKRKIGNRTRMKNGNVIPNFELVDKDGKVYTLKDFKDKYIMLDFGGYYCHWCVKEFPNVARVCSKYKDKGMVLLSINMDGSKTFADKDHERQSRYLSKYNIDLNKYYLTPKGEVNKLVGEYNIDGYPYIILVGPDGKIIEKNLRGKQMAMVADQCFN